MPRQPSIGDEQLLDQLAHVFRKYGYNGASIAEFSRTTGLQKASLYHRFPGGKEQMARAVLSRLNTTIEEHLIAPLGDATRVPVTKVPLLTRQLNKLYDRGRSSCLLNMMAYPMTEEGLFAREIKAAFSKLIKAIAGIATELGSDSRTAREQARTVLFLLHGGLVVAKGMGSTAPFRQALLRIESVLLKDQR